MNNVDIEDFTDDEIEIKNEEIPRNLSSAVDGSALAAEILSKSSNL
jgi:hypothetical protein